MQEHRDEKAQLQSPQQTYSPETDSRDWDAPDRDEPGLFDALNAIAQRWLDRMQTETALAAEMSSQLSSARTLSDTADAFQHWTNRHLELAAEDAREILNDSQKLMAAGARFWQASSVGDMAEARSVMS